MEHMKIIVNELKNGFLIALKTEAKLILVPEFALVGYQYQDNIWDLSEPLEGLTYKWLREIAEEHQVYIGICILEKDGNDLFDTFILVGPNLLWSHRKIEPASYEAFYFKGGGLSDNVIETSIGRIGVAICFDSSKYHTLNLLKKNKPDILLIPFSCPELSSLFGSKVCQDWHNHYKLVPSVYAKELNIPVITSK